MLPLSVHMVGWASTRAGLPAAARLGFRSAEVFALGLWANDPADVAAWLSDAGMTLSAVYLDLPDEPARAAAAASRAAASAAAVAAGMSPATSPAVPRLIVTGRGGDLGQAVAVVSAAGAASAAAGMRLCLHPHQGTTVETTAQAAAVLADTDPDEVWVCVDTGHLLLAGDDPAAAVTAWAPRLGAVHLKDVDDSGRVVPLGTGRLALGDMLAAIAAARAAGAPLDHLTLEIEGYDDPDAPLLASAAAVNAAVMFPAGPAAGARR